MRWNKKKITCKDGTDIYYYDTADYLTSGVVVCFADPACEHGEERIDALALLLAEKNIAVAYLDSDLFADRDVSADSSSVPSLYHISRMTEFFYSFQSMCERKYRSFIMSYAEGYAASVIEYCVTLEEDFPSFLSLLAKEDNSPDDIAWRINPHKFFCPSPASDTTIMITGVSSYSRIRYIPEHVSPDALCQMICSGLRPMKERIWKSMLFEADQYEEDAPERIEYLKSMTLDFTGCPEAAAKLHEICLRDTTGRLCRESVEDFRDLRGAWLNDWPDELFWLVAAADSGHTPSRVSLFNNYMNRDTMKQMYGRLRYMSENGHSFAAILLGLAAESKWLSGDGEGDLFPQRTREDTIRLAEAFYRHAASMGDPEGWYRLGRIKEYSQDRTEEAWDCYEKAAEEKFVPALMKNAWRLEQNDPEGEQLQELADLYESITDQVDLSPVWVRLGRCKEKLGEGGEAFDDYVCSLDSPDPYELEKTWSYLIMNDQRFGVLCLDAEEEEDLSAEACFRMGMLLMDHPDWQDDAYDSPAECFRKASAGTADQIDYWVDQGKDPDFSEWHDVTPLMAQSLFQIGLCRMTERESGSDLHKTLIFFKAAASFGVKEALHFAKFLQEAEAFMEVAVSSCPDGMATEEMRIKEAEYQLGILTLGGLSEEIIQGYSSQRTAFLLEEDGSFRLPDPDDEGDQEIARKISLFEKSQDVSVYLALIEEDYPVRVDLFYVSPYMEEWKFAREQLADHKPFVYVFGIGQRGRKLISDEVGIIGISVGSGIMVRIW